MQHYPSAQIDLSALRHNLSVVRQHTGAHILAMIKANAYGHGLIPIAQALQEEKELSAFGVARFDEAMTLLEAGIKKNIVIMGGMLTAEQFMLAAAHRFNVIIHSEFQLDLLEKTSLSTPLSVRLKIDMGMHRLGFLPEQAEKAYQRLMACVNVAKPICFLTHFPCADHLENSDTEQQAEHFFKITQQWQGEKSLANSGTLLAFPNTQADWVRPGIMLYGASPFAEKTAEALNLKPVMTLRAQVIAVRQLKKGDAIGYGGTFVCPEDMPVAIVGIGYGDGYPRHAPSGTPVLIRHQTLPLVGRVSMDMIAVDLRTVPHVEVGDEVILWGKGLPAEVIAQHADTIAYELFCRLTSRVKFYY